MNRALRRKSDLSGMLRVGEHGEGWKTCFSFYFYFAKLLREPRMAFVRFRQD